MSDSTESKPQDENQVEETPTEVIEEEEQTQEAELSTDDKVAKLEEELKAEKEKALRAHAEMVNFRKRQEKERGVWNQMAVKDVISAILDPLDNLERTIEAATHTQEGEENDPKLVNLAEGLTMVVQQFEEVFKRKNVICVSERDFTTLC